MEEPRRATTVLDGGRRTAVQGDDMRVSTRGSAPGRSIVVRARTIATTAAALAALAVAGLLALPAFLSPLAASCFGSPAGGTRAADAALSLVWMSANCC